VPMIEVHSPQLMSPRSRASRLLRSGTASRRVFSLDCSRRRSGLMIVAFRVTECRLPFLAFLQGCETPFSPFRRIKTSIFFQEMITGFHSLVAGGSRAHSISCSPTRCPLPVALAGGVVFRGSDVVVPFAEQTQHPLNRRRGDEVPRGPPPWGYTVTAFSFPAPGRAFF